MDPVHREQIMQNKNKLVHLINFDVLLSKLSETGIFTDDMLGNISSAGPSLLDKNDKLLSSLPKRGPTAFDAFVKCLVESEQLSAARVLHPAIPDAGVWNGSVTPATRAVPADQSIYEMRSKPRGVALVISNTIFDDNSGLKSRAGGEIDEENLKRLFAYLDFNVDLHTNKSAQDIYTIIEDFRGDLRHADANSCIVAILSHGSPNGFYGSDGCQVSNEKIIEKFNNIHCPMLRNKPKVFFLQHCRGDTPDYAIHQRSYDPVYPDAGTMWTQSDDTPSLPAWSDIKICYSTSPKLVSLRSAESGTWFIRVLVEVFSEKAHDTHLDKMLREVANRMLELNSYEGWKQSPEFRDHGWRRKLYFNPGI